MYNIAIDVDCSVRWPSKIDDTLRQRLLECIITIINDVLMTGGYFGHMGSERLCETNAQFTEGK